VQDIDEHLIDPMNALFGGIRPKGVSIASFKAGLDRLRADLRYLTEPQLKVVANECELMGQAFRSWPVAGLIIQRADQLFPNPDLDRERTEGIARYMRCKVGIAALDGDYAVEMLAALREMGPRYISITANSKQVDRWKDKAHDRRVAKDRAERADRQNEVDFWQEREDEARGLVMSSPDDKKSEAA